jgi:hypothetical protein
MFALSVVSTVGNGRNTLFWSDRWLHGCCLEDLAPNVCKCVPVKFRRSDQVQFFEAMQDHTWVQHIRSLLVLLDSWNIYNYGTPFLPLH